MDYLHFLANAVNGSWGSWNNITPCPVTCGGGSQTRRRYCNDPVPKNGGLFCDSGGIRKQNETGTITCGAISCPGWVCLFCSHTVCHEKWNSRFKWKSGR